MKDHLFAQADALHIPMASRSVDAVICSPPYMNARLYLENGVNLGIARDRDAWVDWMLLVVAECLRVSKGPVIVVAAGSTVDRNYQAAVEGLAWEWSHGVPGSGVWQDGIELPAIPPEACSMYRPVYWFRSGIPGNGGDDWFRADVEYCLCFKRPGKLSWSDNTACGQPPKHGPGGSASYRGADGKRTGSMSWKRGRRANGNAVGSEPAFQSNAVQILPKIANPGNLIATTGGHLGHPIAHENEAPFPESLVEFFIKSLVPPGGLVLDCFSGSGTTVSVAERLGRRGIGFDLRLSQCKLGVQRLERPHAPVVKASRAEKLMPLFS